MTTLLFDQTDRAIFRDGTTLHAARIRLAIAVMRLKRTIGRKFFKLNL